MSSLRQILAHHQRVLLVDTCSARIQVGWLESNETALWATSDKEAGIGLFESVASLRKSPSDAGAFVFCDGPGSLLGIRTAAMALRTWSTLAARPTFAYHSLDLVAHSASHRSSCVIADARRDSWHCTSTLSKLTRVPTTKLSGDLVMPEGFRNWTPLPPGVRTATYVIQDLFAELMDADLLRPTDAPDAYLHEEPSYVTWTPRIHRAP